MSNQHNTERFSLQYLRTDEEELVVNALDLAKSHQAHIPRSDAQTFEHVLRTVTAWRLPAQTILTFLAYHLMEHGVALLPRQDLFDDDILQKVQICQALDRPSTGYDEPEHLRKAHRTDRLRQLYVTAYQNLQLVLLCAASHLARMNAIDLMEYRDARLLAEENEAIFLPLTEMLGMWGLRRTLGDIGLKNLNPKNVWNQISQQQRQVEGGQRQCFEGIRETLVREFNKRGIKADTRLHLTAVSSIYRRMVRGEALSELVKPVRVDIVVPTTTQCYQVLGLIHQQWSPLGGRTLLGVYLRDWIALPKFNGYRALYTTVGYHQTDGTKIPVEFRMYTPDMEQITLDGVVAAKFLSPTLSSIRNVWWMNEELLEFVRARQVGESSEEIFVFSPIGEVDILPKDSTPIDYAYRRHSQIGHNCKRIWVNGRPASYNRKLRNGDLVEIEVDPRYSGPDGRWLRVVRTTTAKKHIKRALRQRRITPHRGRAIIDKILKSELEAYHLDIPPTEVDKFIEDTAGYLSYPSPTALYFDIADPDQSLREKKPSPNVIVTRLIANHLADHVVKPNGQAVSVPKNRIKFTQCNHNGQLCRVTPGSEIVGRLVQGGTRHERLVVYRCDCPYAPHGADALPLAWLGDKRPGEPVRVGIEAVDKARLLEQVLDVVYGLYDHGLYLLGVQASVARDHSARIQMIVDAPDYRRLEILDESLRRLQGTGIVDEVRIDALSPIDKLLLREPDALPNPYTTGPARGSRIFKGRDAEIGQIMTCLKEQPNLVILYGMHRVGKTSLLHYLCDLVSRDFEPVLIDMPGLVEHSEARLWREIAARMDTAISHLYGIKTGRFRSFFRKKGDSFESFCDWLEQARAQIRGRKWLVMLDELNAVEELWRSRDEAARVVYRLKSLAENQSDVAFVFSVQEAFYREAAFSETEAISWPLLRVGFPLQLGYLDHFAAERLIKEPVGQMLHVEDFVVHRIVQMTAGHPYYLQNIMRYLIEEIQRRPRKPGQKSKKITVTPEILEVVIPQLLQHGESLFYDFTRRYKDETPDVLRALAYLSGSDERGVTFDELWATFKRMGYQISRLSLEQAVESLMTAGAVERLDRSSVIKYRIRVPLFRQWLVENHPLHISPAR